MDLVFNNGLVFRDGKFVSDSICVSDGICVSNSKKDNFSTSINCNNFVLLPGFADVHVHLREPGFCYKETIDSGTRAAAKGGYTTVCAMPNINPVPDSIEHLSDELRVIKNDAVIRVIPYGAITIGRLGKHLSDMNAIAPYVVGFSDDGSGIQSRNVMKQAMIEAKSLNKIIVAHCEENSLLHDGYIHDGLYAKQHGHLGISSESEWKQLERDLELVDLTGCSYHACHISTKESVELIRNAKKDGLDVTCETAPHYLLLDESFLQDDGSFKMNPPIRSKEDKEALIQGVIDGTIDMIATDHAPHSKLEKSKGLKGSAMGVVGIEIAFPLLYTYLVKTGIIPFVKLIELLHDAPYRRFGFDGSLSQGERADFSIFDLNDCYTIDSSDFISKGKSTPFNGWKVYGRCLMTISKGEIAWIDSKMEGNYETM